MSHANATLVLLFFLTSSIDAQDLRSGPEPGKALTPIKVYAPSGPRAGKEFDAAEVIGKAPGALLFVHELTRPAGQVIGGLDGLALEYAAFGFRSFTVMLSADRTTDETQAKRSSDGLRLLNPMVLSIDGAEGPGDYALNRKCALTLVLVKDGKVHKSVAFTDTGRQDVPKVRKLIEEVAGTLPADDAELRKVVGANLPEDPAALKDRTVDLALAVIKMRRQIERQMEAQAQRPARGDMQRPQAQQGEMPATRPESRRDGGR